MGRFVRLFRFDLLVDRLEKEEYLITDRSYAGRVHCRRGVRFTVCRPRVKLEGATRAT
jgi:hypothetical protein